MIRHCFIHIVILLVLAPAPSLAFKVPDVPDGEVRIYRVYHSDPELDTQPQTGMQALTRQWSPQWFRVELDRAGEGEDGRMVYRRSEILFNGSSSEWTFEFAPGRELALDRFERKVTSPQGGLLFREAYMLRDPALEYPGTMFHAWVLEFAFRGLELSPGKSHKLWVWASPLLMYEMELKVVARETIELPIGARDCFKLEMATTPANYTGVSGAIMHRLAPTYTFWMLADRPHCLARQEGPVGLVEGIRPPKQIQELAFLASAENPEGIGTKPRTRPPVPTPEIVSGPPFRMPFLPQSERRRFRVRFETPVKDLSGLPFNQQLMYRESATGIEKLARRTGEGENSGIEYIRTEKLHNDCTAVTRFRFRPGGLLKLEDITRTHTSPSGAVVRDEYYSIDDPFFNYPANLCHPFTMELAYRGMELVEGNSREFHLWLGPGITLKMLTRVDGIEELSLDDGTGISCYRLEMFPDIEEYVGAVGRLIQPIVPRYTWWLEQAGTHPQVRYRGPLGQVNMINAPVEVHEIETGH